MADEKTIKIEGATIEGVTTATVTNTGGAAAVQGDVHTGGGNMTGHDSVRYAPNTTTGNVTFGNQDNAILMNAIITMGNQVNERINAVGNDLNNKINTVDVKLDDLPARVGKLEVKVEPVPVPIPLTIPLAVAFPPTFWAMIAIITFGLLAVAFFVGRGF